MRRKMADIAELSIQIEASAEKASKEIDKLIRRLDKLHTKLAGIDVSSLTGQLQALANVDLSNLDKLTGVKVPGISGGSGGRGGGGGSTIHLTSGIKQLGSALNSSRKAIVNTSHGLANLAKNTTIAKLSIGQLANTFMRLYFRIFMVRRIISGLGKIFTKSMDMIETYHYFDVAISKIGEGAKKDFAQYGYDSAEAYADSFRKRSLELTEKMSGYAFDEKGNYTSNGRKNLGLDADLIMQYQAQYGQIADSIGMTGEAALATSKALTMLATDWSSLRNIDFETAFEKMASGLAGQSRAVRSLGIDITQASLQQTAYNLGITTSISKMDQAAKAELRMITILDQSRVAWGDLASTLNTPANQLRMIKQNTMSLARAIGNVFLPVVQKVLPYVNALVIAIRRLFEWIGGLLGVKVSNASSGMSGLNDAFVDMGDDGTDALGGIADASDDANKKLKELKRTVLAFDELNILNGNDDDSSSKSKAGTGSGGTGLGAGEQGILDASLLDMLDEYEKVWNEAFEKMEDKANAIADKITGVFGKIHDFIKAKDWAGLGGYIANGINQGLDWIYEKMQAVSPKITEFVGNVAKTLNGLVDKVNWTRIGQIFATGLNGITNTINKWYDTFDFRNLGSKIGVALKTGLDTVNWTGVGQLLVNKFNAMVNFVRGVVTTPGIWESLGRSVSSLLNGALAKIDLVEAANTIAITFNGFFESMKTFITNFNWDELKNKLRWSINAFIRKVDFTEAAATLMLGIGKVLDVILTTISSIDIKTLARKLTGAINQMIWSFDPRAAASKLGDAIMSILKVIEDTVVGIDWRQVGINIGLFLENLPWGSIFGSVLRTVVTVVGGLWEGLGETFAGRIIQGFLLFKGFAKLLGFTGGISGFLGSSTLVIAQMAAGGLKMLTSVITGGIALLKGKISSLLVPLTTAIKDALTNAKPVFTSLDYGALGASLGFAATISGLVLIGKKIGEIQDEARGGNGIVTDYGKMWDYVIDELRPKLGDAHDKLFKIKEDLENSNAPAEEFSSTLRQGLEEAGVPAEDVEKALGNVVGKINATSTQMEWLSTVTEGYAAKTKVYKEELDFTETGKTFGEFKDTMINHLWEIYEGTENAENAENQLKAAIASIEDDAKPEVGFGAIREAMESLNIPEERLLAFFKNYFPEYVKTGVSQVSGSVSGAVGNVKKSFSDMQANVSTIIGNMQSSTVAKVAGMSGTIATSFAGIKSDAESKTDSTTRHVTTKWDETKRLVSAAIEGAKAGIAAGITKFNNNIAGYFNPAVESAKTLETELGVNLANTAKNVGTNLPSFFAGVSGAIASHFSGTYDNIYRAMNVSGMYGLGASITNGLQSGISSRRLSLPHVGWNWQRLTYGPADNRQWFEVPQLYVNWYAKGGIPNAGELFWMNENNNPELMYKKGGKTHIDSNTEIVNSLKEAFTDSLMDVAMSMSSQSNNGQAPVIEYTFKVDSETMFKTVQKGAKKMSGRGYKFESAF